MPRRTFVSNLFRRAYCHEWFRVIAKHLFPVKHPRGWIFICGCYNSGTTLLRDLLGATNQVQTLPQEGVRFTSHLTRPEDHGWTRMWIRCEEHLMLSRDQAVRIGPAIRQDWSPWFRNPSQYFLEKSIANVPRMCELEAAFSKAKFVGIVRNGYCVAEGIRRRARPRGSAAKELGRSEYPIDMCGHQWQRSNELMLKYGRMVEDYYQVRYEDLIAQPKEELQGLLDWLEIEGVRMAFCDSELIINNSSFMLFDGNSSSKRRLDSTDMHTLSPIVDPLMERLGYDSS